MSDSWEWVEAHNSKRERQRKRLRIASMIATAWFLLFVLGIGFPDLPRSLLWMDRGADDEHTAWSEETAKSLHPGSASPETQSNDSDVNFDPGLNAQGDSQIDTDSQEDASQSESTQSVPERIAAPTNTRSDPSTIVEPRDETVPAPDPRLQRDAERALSLLQRKIESANQGTDWLEKYGGEDWSRIERLSLEAANATDPERAMELADQATSLINTSLPKMHYAEFLAVTRGKDSALFVAEMLKFRSQHPDHPQLAELETTISLVDFRTWLEMASLEMENASPDDAGFVEGWLPIAAAWQLAGEDIETREALRRAREGLPRMTNVELAIASTIELCRHPGSDRDFSEQLVRNADKMCGQLSSTGAASSYRADLSGLAEALHYRELAAELRQKAYDLTDIDEQSVSDKKIIFVQQCRAASWYETPESILEVCLKIDRLPYPKPTANADGYIYAATAAARRNDQRQFQRAMFKAETALARSRYRSSPIYFSTVRIAKANMIRRRWREAVITGNNNPDPFLQAFILFRVLAEAPQQVRSPDLPGLLLSQGRISKATPATAAYVEYRLRAGDSLVSMLEWSRTLPLASQRAAVLTGIARASMSPSADAQTAVGQVSEYQPDLNSPASLVEAAEHVAANIDDPMESAFASVQIARTWHLLGRTRGYQNAVAAVDDRCFDLWNKIWNERPPARKFFHGGWEDSDTWHLKQEYVKLNEMLQCLRVLSETQADAGDTAGAMDTCLNIAHTTGFVNSTLHNNDLNYLHLEVIIIRLQQDTGVGPDVFERSERPGSHNRALLAAWTGDVPALHKAIVELEKRTDHHELAHAYGELAILQAGRSNMEAYREARRSALSRVTQRNASSAIKNVLATADARAGEFALAESNLVGGSIRWFGDANRPRSELSVGLARDGQWEKAITHAAKISAEYPNLRGDAWEAVARSRFKQKDAAPESLLDWAESLKTPQDRIAALCGLALEAETAQR